MQTLRKKNSPCKFKNDPSRFLGEGVSFKAKLIGILEVSEARGDRMCQAALADLKMAIRAAGEHKQRIAVQVSIDGLRLRDEKSGDCLYHHPVHKISFIAQDMSDSRAFGYIFGSPDTGHRFFGIKTDKAASQVVIAMRDLFQVVFELKKKEIELAKQRIEPNTVAIKFHTGGIFVEPAPDTKGAAGSDSSIHRMRAANLEAGKSSDRKNDSQSGVIADLLDLQFELNSLQQGIHQMDKITPDNPVASTDDLFESDPFGDSFANMKLKESDLPSGPGFRSCVLRRPLPSALPILLPPPSSSKRGHLERQQTIPAPTSSSTSSPVTTASSKTPPPQSSSQWFGTRKEESDDLFNDNELTNLAKGATNKKEQEENLLNATPRSTSAKSPQIDVFTELDPLGTGLKKPYVDKKDFFQHLKNPPKKVLKDLVSTNATDTFATNFNITSEPLDSVKLQNDQPPKEDNGFDDGNFANFDKFDENEASQVTESLESPHKKESISRVTHHQPLSVSLPPEDTSFSKNTSIGSTSTIPGASPATNRQEKSTAELTQTLTKLLSPKKYVQSSKKKEFDMDLSKAQSTEKPFPVDFTMVSDSPASPLKSCSSDANSRLSSSSIELDLVPEPPPRGVGSILINPPPLPPKKQIGRSGIKPPPRPPHGDGHFHYDFLEREEASPSPTRMKDRTKREETKTQFDDNFSPPPHVASRPESTNATTTDAFEDSFNSMIPSTNISSLFTYNSTPVQVKKTKPSLDITLSQLTSSNLAELANSLDMTVQELTSLTLQQLTECLANLSAKESGLTDNQESTAPTETEQINQEKPRAGTKIVETCFVSNEPLFKTTFDPEPKQDSTYDKYAVFRELFEMEQMREGIMNEDTREPEFEEEKPEKLETQEDAENDNEHQTIASLVNLTVILPPIDDELVKSDSNTEVADEIAPEDVTKKESYSDEEEIEKDKPKDVDIPLESLSEQLAERDSDTDVCKKAQNVVEDVKTSEEEDKLDESNDVSERMQKVVDNKSEEINSPTPMEAVDIKTSTSTSSDRYAALREIIGETEQPTVKNDEETSSRRSSPALPIQSSSSKSLAEVELLNLFSDNLPPPSSPKKVTSKNEDDLKAVAMDIFEEIKMLNTGTHLTTESKQPSRIPGFEDMFCPLAETRQEKNDNKDDGNWAKFDSNIFTSDRSSCEGVRSVGGTSPWSPDGKVIHRETMYKGSHYRHSGDSDNEWKDEEESEESNGRRHGDGRFWNGRHSRFEAPIYDDRSIYDLDTPTSGERQRSYRDRGSRKSRSGVPWTKAGHRPCDPSPWHEEGHWEEEPRRYPPRSKVPYKDEEEMQYEARWKCRSKTQRYPWGQEGHGPYYDEDKQRKMMLWNDEDRFGNQESPGYDDDERWSRRKYERRRWEEDARFWGRRLPPDGDYPTRESYYYYRETRDRPHDYPPPSSGWDEGYGPDRPSDESPRYNPPPGRKRHWPKRPNSANEGRNTDMPYIDPRSKFGSRSECSDNDSDPYPRSSQRSRSRESYWGSDQECDSWVERPYWSEGPDSKSESLHRKRIPRHKTRPQQPAKTQSPFEDDFAHQSVEGVESPTNVTAGNVEALGTLEPRMRTDLVDQKREQPLASPSSGARGLKEPHPRKEGGVREYGKRSSFFEDDLTPTASASSDASDRQRHSSELKATPEELPCDGKEHQHSSIDSFASEDSRRDSFYNGELRFDDDAFTFKSELEDNVPDHRMTMKNARQMKFTGGSNNNNNKTGKGDQYIRKSESVNIFARENDPFDDDDFFN